MLTLNKFIKMRDDEMMISISVKTTRMYANGFNTPKDNCLNSGIWIYLYFDFWEFIFYFHFFWKKKISGKLHQNSRKKCWHAVQKSKKRKAVQAYFIQRYMYGGIFTVNGVTSVCSSKSTRSLIICTIYIIAKKITPRLKSLITFLEWKTSPTKQDSY